MPIYEYQCARCGEIFEAFEKMTDQPLTECRSCKGKVERLISQSSFQLKGSGWYMTDYARKAAPAGEEASKTTEGKGETKEGSKEGSKEPAKESKSDKKPLSGESPSAGS